MQLAFGVAREPEGLEQIALVSRELFGDELADPDHFVAVVAVGDDEDVLAEPVEDREVVRREAADPARRLVAIDAALAGKALLAMGERRTPHAPEILADNEIGALRAIRVDRHLVGSGLDLERHGAALDAAEIEIRLVVDAPQLVG